MSVASHAFVSGVSRSGTTLLAAMLDAHPAVSMGYELMPTDLPPDAVAAERLAAAIREHGDDSLAAARRLGNALRDSGDEAFGRFVKRAARCRVSPAELRGLLADGVDVSATTRSIALSAAVVERKRRSEGSRVVGWKLSVTARPQLPADWRRPVFLCLVRDPRDVAESQRRRGMSTSVEEVAAGWCRHFDAAERRRRSHPDEVVVIRYETLVRDPRSETGRLCTALGLDWDPAMLRPEQSKASVFTAGQRHANAATLAGGITDARVGAWREVLGEREVSRLEAAVGGRMIRAGYRRETRASVADRFVGAARSVLARRRRRGARS